MLRYILGRMSRSDVAEALAAKYNKALGPGAIVLAKDMILPRRFTSGSLSLDVSLNGGWPGNHWVEIYGPENHGKTAITLKTIAANQAQDPEFHTLWIASEHYDLDQAIALGVDTNRIHVMSTQDMPVAYDAALDWLSERGTDAVVIDSYPAMIPPDEDSKDMDEYTQAEGAKMTNKFFRKVGKAGLRNPLDPGDRPWFGIFINQPRERIGGIPGRKNETTPGGRGKNFAFYTRLDVQRTEWIGEGPGKEYEKTKVGQVIKTNTVKHKGGPPQRVAFIDFYFAEAPEHGFHRGDYDIYKDVGTMSILFDVVHKAGAYISYEDRKWKGEKINPAMAQFIDSLREEPDLLAAVDKRTREAAANPHDRRTWDEAAAESANTGVKKVRRRVAQ